LTAVDKKLFSGFLLADCATAALPRQDGVVISQGHFEVRHELAPAPGVEGTSELFFRDSTFI